MPLELAPLVALELSSLGPPSVADRSSVPRPLRTPHVASVRLDRLGLWTIEALPPGWIPDLYGMGYSYLGRDWLVAAEADCFWLSGLWAADEYEQAESRHYGHGLTGDGEPPPLDRCQVGPVLRAIQVPGQGIKLVLCRVVS